MCLEITWSHFILIDIWAILEHCTLLDLDLIHIMLIQPPFRLFSNKTELHSDPRPRILLIYWQFLTIPWQFLGNSFCLPTLLPPNNVVWLQFCFPSLASPFIISWPFCLPAILGSRPFFSPISIGSSNRSSIDRICDLVSLDLYFKPHVWSMV